MTIKTTAVELAAEITIAWLSNQNNQATVQDVSAILRSTYDSVARLEATGDNGASGATEIYTPAVSVRKSLASRDHIISLLDGKPYKTLRRHLANNGFTPEQYRARYGLKLDYPIVSESYSEVRRAMALKTGLGRKSGTRSKLPAEPATEAVPSQPPHKP